MRKFMLSIGLLLYLQVSYGQQRQVDKVVAHCDSILNLLSTEKDSKKKTELILSFYSTSIDGFPLALLNLSKQLITTARRNNDIYVESAAQSAAAQGYRLTGNYVRALEYHRRAVALAEQTGDKVLLGFATNQMGHIYKDRFENERALSLYRQAAALFKQGGREDIWYPDMNMGTVFLNKGEYDSSLHYAITALNKMAGTPGIGNQSNVFANVASIYSRQNKMDSVHKYYSLALAMVNRVESPRYMSTTYLSMAEHYKFHKQADSAAFYYKRAVDAVIGTELSNMALTPAKYLTEYYQNLNADSTVKYWKVYSAANDSINSFRTNQMIQMLTFEEEQRKKDAEAAAIAYRNKIRTGLLLGGLGVFSLVAIVLYRNNRQKQKANAKLEKTLQELKATQKQLIQSEKMASLGELTAGIAHEIQNPLNFVNNFSEVSAELIDEMKTELQKGDVQEGLAIANDLQQNLEKINHHGKRADAIVKGMLEHSRAGSGERVPTDINALADEYLRLAYHGLRAKDKDFNADLQTKFDAGIGLVNIIPQDMGRAILNLISNALYAVNERSKRGEAGYKPMVKVSTERRSQGVEIRVEDNADGIPERIKEKIFQPFFTTKPTGQGTGLGLSLAYDIVKAHEGALTVESVEGQGTVFVILLRDQ